MARPQTVARVHAAVLSLAERAGPDALTMEGIAAEAGVGKQTLYRSWPSVHAILFDALVAEPEGTRAGDGDGDGTIVGLLRATIEEISTEPRASLLRLLAASIQTDAAVAAQFHERLLGPQLTQVRRLVAAAGYARPQTSAELLLAPIFYRWFMRLPQFDDVELREHAARILAMR